MARSRLALVTVGALLVLAGAIGAQPVPLPTADVPTARAVRSGAPIRLDGRDDDAAWRTAPVTSDFLQFSPGEAVPARFRTAFQVAYDDHTLYVFVRAFDSHPDSLVSLLSRRDVRTPSEWIKVIVDGFHDRRTGLQFMVNPAGVKRDATIFSDVIEDGAWDGVWDVAVQVDSLGWTAEYAIPFSQLRFTPKDVQVFGFGVWRDDARHGERDSWPAYRVSRRTFASQLGDLVGIEGIARNRRLEVMPYFVTKNVTAGTPADWRHPQQQSAGLDLKAGLTSNITVDATFNPDFGQVEADPAILNLSAFEVRFEERRPFFQEGLNLFRCEGPCEGIFYTRRAGRTPQLRSSDEDPLSTTIQAAAKVTGRFEGGTQFGLVAVSSAREEGAAGQTIEPRTLTLVGRLVQDFRGGRSQLGTMVTGLTRDLDAATEPILRREAYTLLVQGYHRFADRWEVSGYSGRSTARGSAAAIARTQLTSVHYRQRPDHDIGYDPTLTALDGGVTSLSLKRFAGRVNWTSTARYAAPGSELNDLGFVPLIDDILFRNQVSLLTLQPGGWYRRANVVLSSEQHWTSGGLPTGIAAVVHGGAELSNFWGAAFTWNAFQLGAAHCVSCTRGGPALRVSPTQRVALNLNGDDRRAIRPAFEYSVSRGDEGRSWAREASVEVRGRIGTRSSIEFGVGIEQRADDAQPVGNFGVLFSDTIHYTFAHLRQNILELEARANVTISPDLSVQLYAQPFVASGAFSDWRELADPRAASYADRFAPYGGGARPAGFNEKQFNSNVVLRWEYRLGSVLFLVWQQGRGDARDPGTFNVQRDLRNLFNTHPDNTLLIKLSYWFNP